MYVEVIDILTLTAVSYLYPCCWYSEIYTETETGEEVLLTGLCPFTTYNVSVSASTAVGEGPSQSINFTTLQEGKTSCDMYGVCTSP